MATGSYVPNGSGAVPHSVTVAIHGEPKNDAPFTRPVVSKTTKTPKPPKTTPKTTKTLAPAYGSPAWFTQEVNAQIDPQVAAMHTQQAQYDAEQQANEAQLTGFYKALAGIIQGQAPAVSQAYDTAARGVGAIAGGLSQGAAALEQGQAGQMQQLLQNAGQGQAAGYVGGKASPGAAALDPFTQMNGVIPGSTLEATGAARASEAAAQPGIFAAQGRDALTVAIQKAVAGDKEFQQKIADIYTQVPALRDKIVQEVQSYQLQQRQLKDSEQALGIKTQLANAKLTLAQKTALDNYNAKIDSINAQLAIAGQSDATRRALEAQREKYTTALAKWKLANGIGVSGSKNKGMSQSQVKHLRSGIAHAFYGYFDPKFKTTDPKTGKVTYGKKYPPVGYLEAIREAKLAGYSTADATKMANRFYKPGQRGRPASADQHREAAGLGVQVAPP